MARKRAPVAWSEHIPGGLSKGMAPSDFDAQSLAEGTLVETEHTSDFMVAVEIAMDHLAEDPAYYKKLAKIEKKKKNPSLEAENQTVIQSLLEAGVSCQELLTAIFENVAPHIMNAALEDTVRGLARTDPEVARRFSLLSKGRTPVDPRTGRRMRFPTARPFVPNPTVTGVDGKKRSFEDPRKRKKNPGELERKSSRQPNPAPTTDLIRRLKF